MSPYAAELLLREAYDITYGIFDHVQQSNLEKQTRNPALKRPFALVELHPAEDTSGADQFERAAYIFASLKMNQKFGISFNEYLSYSPARVEQLIKVAEKLAKSEKAVLKDALDGM